MTAQTRPPRRSAAGGGSWSQAAEDLAWRVNRRDRLGVLLTRVGSALLIACAPALAWRAVGPAPDFLGVTNRMIVAGLLGVGILVGLVLAWRTTAAAQPSTPAYAAWALDRLARAGGRGIAAACAIGPAASEAAYGGTPLALPPTARLLPPHGLVPLVGGVLLGVLALLAPAGAAPDESRQGGELTGLGAGAPGAADGTATEAETKASALDRRAEEARAVRKALNLPPDGPLDPAEIEARIGDPTARTAAAKAAGAGTALADALGGSDPTGEHLAGLLDPGEDNRSRAQARRREAAAARAQSSQPHVPAARRDVVTNYLQRID